MEKFGEERRSAEPRMEHQEEGEEISFGGEADVQHTEGYERQEDSIRLVH